MAKREYKSRPKKPRGDPIPPLDITPVRKTKRPINKLREEILAELDEIDEMIRRGD